MNEFSSNIDNETMISKISPSNAHNIQQSYREGESQDSSFMKSPQATISNQVNQSHLTSKLMPFPTGPTLIESSARQLDPDYQTIHTSTQEEILYLTNP